VTASLRSILASLPARALHWARLAAALALMALLTACMSLDPPGPPPKSVAVPTPRPTIADRSEVERRRLIEAYDGEMGPSSTTRYLDAILARLTAASDTPSATYRLGVLNSPVVNAFALPSGEIFVTRGLLALANDESEIAAVMAHEMAHITAHHAAQRAELERTALLFKRVATQVLADSGNPDDAQSRMQLTIARFSRDQEFEADKIGIRVTARAGYDPYAASRFLTSLGRWSALSASLAGLGDGGKVDMMATHPSTPDRIAQAVVEARQFGAPGVGETGRDAYFSAIDGLAFGDDPAQGLVRGREFIHAKLGFAFTAPDGFILENQSAALIGVAEGGAEALRLDSVADTAQSPEASLETGWIDGVETKSIEPLKLGDLTAATATARGDVWSFRLAAVRLGGRLYRLVYAAHNLTPNVDEKFQTSILSFHRLDAEEIAGTAGDHVRIVEAQPGETAESVAARMAVPSRPLDEFLALNGLDRSGVLTAGQRYKIVAQ